MIELKNIVYAVTGSAVLQVVGMHVLHVSMPRSYPVLYLLLLFFLTGFSRFIWRILPERTQETEQKPDTIRTMIVGAGEAGNMLLKELVGSSHLNRKIVCIIDDDRTKIGTYLHGVPVAGTAKQIPPLAERYGVNEIIVAIPSASSSEKKKILESCSRAVGCNVLTLPGIYQIINGDVHVSMLRKIEINDLLGREPVDLRMETIMRYVKDIEIGDTTYTKQENGSFTAPSTAAAVGQTATALPASSISVSGSVNRKKPGTYELTYTMQDKNGRHFYSNMAF